MADTTNTNKMKSGKDFNPTVTALFENDRFGQGALLSAAIDAKGFSEVQKHLQIGSKLLIRKSPKANKNGGSTYFVEILPPMTGENTNRRSNSTANDDI